MLRFVIPLAASFCLLLAGCGQSGMGKVKGKVTFNGAPLVSGIINFLPAKGRPAQGKIKNGEIIEVTTVSLNDGVLVGPCAVTIQSPSNPDNMYAKQKSLIPEKYGVAASSGFKADIKPGENEVKFDLQ